MRFWLALALILIAPGLVGPVRADEFASAKAAYRSLEENVKLGRDPANWRNVAKSFETASLGSGDGEASYYAGLCFEHASRLSEEEADVKRALDNYSRLYNEFKGSSFADDGLFRTARLFENTGDLTKAKDYYRRIIDKYPKGDMVELARLSVDKVGRERELNGVRHWSGPTYTRIVLELSALSPYEFKRIPPDPALKKGHRLFLDLKRTLVAKTCDSEKAVGDGLVTQVRVSQFSKDTARVAVDLGSKAEFKIFPLLDPARMVIDIYRDEGETDVVAALIEKIESEKESKGSKTVAPSNTTAIPSHQVAPVPPAPPVHASAPIPPPSAPVAEKTKPRKLKIVLDPGHGGRDPGAIGPGGLMEKDVVLKIAKEVKKRLESKVGCEVILTRDDDTELILARRIAIANTHGADLFISIHANASPSKKARGIETYFLDRSSDRSARRVAAQENKTSETGVLETEQILADVILNMKLPESRRLAEEVQKGMLDRVVEVFGPERDLGVKRAPFYVLTGAVMPAILIETAFISNPVEAAWLRDEKFHGVVADAVSGAVSKFTEGP